MKKQNYSKPVKEMNLDELIAAGLLVPVDEIGERGVHVLVVDDDNGIEQMYRFMPRTEEATT